MERVNDKSSKGSRGSLRLALPSDGEMYESTLQFLQGCDLEVERAGPRRYTGELPALPSALAVFQRAADIPAKVEEGTADVGIVGLDRYMESHREDGDAVVVMDDLGFSRCELVIAVPEAWADVTSTADLADLAVEFRESGRELRIATKYPMLVERFLYARGIHYFTLIAASGTLEVAPAMGYADLIADLTATGVTLRENGLKTLADGSILTSQACLIVNRRLLAGDDAKLSQAKELLERVEAHIRAQGFYAVTTSVQGAPREAATVGAEQEASLRIVQGVSIVQEPNGPRDGRSSGTVLIRKQELSEAVGTLRRLDEDQIAVTPVAYLFQSECAAYQRLLAYLGEERRG